MAAQIKLSLIIFFACSLFQFQSTLGEEIICEQLPNNMCSLAIASSGKRCLLETYAGRHGKVQYQCRTSEVVVERMAGHIESDECVNACGVDRKAVGISSDAFFEPQFASKLCSANCYQKCTNIIDLYFNLAAGEGVFLPSLCEKQRRNPHRAMIELLSNGAATTAAPAPADSENIDVVPDAPAPSSF